MEHKVIEIRGVTRRFGATAALDSVSLDVPRGIVLGLVGENGAGKTTLVKHVLGLLKATSGSVRVFGLDPVAHPVEVLGRIGYLSEDRDLPEWMRVRELIAYSKAFYPRWSDAFAEELRERFSLDPRQRIRTLSRGQRALAGLLIALAHRPELVVLDEPSSGLDPVVRRDILAAIIRTVTDEGRTVLFSSHLLDEVERVADHLAMMHAGRITLTGPLDSVVANHRKLTLRFRDALPAAPSLPGAISCSGEGLEWTCVCNGEIEKLKQEADRLGATIVDDERASLDDIFVARVRRPVVNPR
jgi:ABC-2 type transport system ATP-binding protein